MKSRKPRTESERYKTLLEIGQSLITINDLDQLLKKIIDVVALEIQAERSLIILRNPISGELQVASSTANIDTNTREDAIQFSKTIVADVVNKGKSIFSRDVIDDENVHKSASVMNLRIRSLMCVPLVSRQNNEILGTIYVDNRSAGNIFSREDLQLLESFANMAGIAIENAHLYELAIIDDLTRCYVRRYFERRLSEEFARAQRQIDNLSILMLDIDDFKMVNDRYGHPMGDAVLREIASLTKKNLRAYDVLARLGGDEFAVILPGVTHDDAVRVAEKIRAAAAAHHNPAIGHPITLSIGIASHPLHPAVNEQSLMQKADVALYRAKELGRNKWILYSEEGEQIATEEMELLIQRSVESMTNVLEQLNRLSGLILQMKQRIEEVNPESGAASEIAVLLARLEHKRTEALQLLQSLSI